MEVKIALESYLEGFDAAIKSQRRIAPNYTEGMDAAFWYQGYDDCKLIPDNCESGS